MVLDLEAVNQIDVTGEEMLTHMSEHLEEAGIEFFITRAKFRIIDTLKRSGLYDVIGEEHFFSKRKVMLEAIKKKYGSQIDISHLEIHKPVDKIMNNE